MRKGTRPIQPVAICSETILCFLHRAFIHRFGVLRAESSHREVKHRWKSLDVPMHKKDFCSPYISTIVCGQIFGNNQAWNVPRGRQIPRMGWLERKLWHCAQNLAVSLRCNKILLLFCWIHGSGSISCHSQYTFSKQKQKGDDRPCKCVRSSWWPANLFPYPFWNNEVPRPRCHFLDLWWISVQLYFEVLFTSFGIHSFLAALEFVAARLHVHNALPMIVLSQGRFAFCNYQKELGRNRYTQTSKPKSRP